MLLNKISKIISTVSLILVILASLVMWGLESMNSGWSVEKTFFLTVCLLSLALSITGVTYSYKNRPKPGLIFGLLPFVAGVFLLGIGYLFLKASAWH